MASPLSLKCTTPLLSSPSSSSSSSRFLINHNSLILPRQLPSSSSLVYARRRSQNTVVTSSSPSKKKNKKVTKKKKEDLDDDDPFEALFSQLEKDLKRDDLSNDDDEDDEDYEITEADIDALALELEEALGEDDDIALLDSATEAESYKEESDDDDDEEEEEDDEPLVTLKNWQLKRLAYALKNGRRKTSIKNLAAELCLDRHLVLKLLREPPPHLLMLSVTLPDEPKSVALVSETKHPELVAIESSLDTAQTEMIVKEPVHVMQRKWSAQKRIKKVHLETLERVYNRSKRPTNAMISSIVQVTNLPRKRVVKWFEDKRVEDGILDQRLPYKRSDPVTVFSG